MTDCLFCKIVGGDIPAAKVYEDDTILAFEDIDPQAPTHILLIPKQHFFSLRDVPDTGGGLFGHILLKAKDIARERGLGEDGYRIVLNTGRDGGQAVFHIHFHLLGGRRMGWPPG